MLYLKIKAPNMEDIETTQKETHDIEEWEQWKNSGKDKQKMVYFFILHHYRERKIHPAIC